MADHPIDNEIARLEDELALRKLEKKLVAAKETKKGPSAELKLEVRQARQTFREKHRQKVAVTPDTVGADAGVEAASGRGN